MIRLFFNPLSLQCSTGELVTQVCYWRRGGRFGTIEGSIAAPGFRVGSDGVLRRRSREGTGAKMGDELSGGRWGVSKVCCWGVEDIHLEAFRRGASCCEFVTGDIHIHYSPDLGGRWTSSNNAHALMVACMVQVTEPSVKALYRCMPLFLSSKTFMGRRLSRRRRWCGPLTERLQIRSSSRFLHHRFFPHAHQVPFHI